MTKAPLIDLSVKSVKSERQRRLMEAANLHYEQIPAPVRVITDAVSTALGIHPSTAFMHTRERKVTSARSCIQAVLRQETNMSLGTIGRYTRVVPVDHTTVIHGCEVALKTLTRYDEYYKAIAAARAAIAQWHRDNEPAIVCPRVTGLHIKKCA